MSVDANLNEVVKSYPDPPLVITDLCDHVLIEIFSHFDLHEKCFIMPQVCRRFHEVSALSAPKEIVSQKLQATKWNERSTSALFRKIGPGLKSITVSYDFRDNGRHLNMMLMEIRMNCVNILDLHIKPRVRMSHLMGLPTTIRKIELDNFAGSLLNLEHLNNLETLHLEVTRIPSASDWIKVNNRLKNIELKLMLRKIRNKISTIDRLMTSISDNYSVVIDLYDEEGYQPLISLDPIKRISNVQEFVIIGYTVRNGDLNGILQHFAETNTIMRLHLGCLTCGSDAPPLITSKTIDSLLLCSSLESIELHSSYYIDSMIVGFTKRLDLRNIRLQYGFVGDTQHHITISSKTFKDIVEFVEKFVTYRAEYSLSYWPVDGLLYLSFQVKDQTLWDIFSKVYVQNTPQFVWDRESFYVEIDAKT